MTSSRSYGYGVLEQALAVSAFAVGPWTTAADQCDANYYADGRSAAVQQRQRDHSGALHHRHSQRCQLAALQPDHWRLPRNDGTVAARRPPPHCQQRCAGGSGSSAAHIAQLRTLWRCPAGSAVCIVAPPAASRPHWRCIRGSARASGASGQRKRPRGAARGHTHSKIERESGHKPRG